MGEWQTVNEVIVRLFERKQRWLLSQLRDSDPFSFQATRELLKLQLWVTTPRTRSLLTLYVKMRGTEQILHAWWRLMSQEEPWSGRLNVILQPRALPRASGTAFQSFVAHIMPPSPVPCHHINMLPQSYHDYCRSNISTFLDSLMV